MELFKSIFTGTFTVGQFIIAVAVSAALGLLVSLFYMYKSQHSKTMAIGLVMIAAIESVVIMMVNGNLGAGIAVAGSFSLIRFRSVKGNAKELTCIFLTMAIGITCGTGYVAVAAMFTIIMLALGFGLTLVNFGGNTSKVRILKITIPESLDYDSTFNDVLNKYTSSFELINTKTLNLGSLFRVEYEVILKDSKQMKEMIDEIRTLNSNLEISCGTPAVEKEEL